MSSRAFTLREVAALVLVIGVLGMLTALSFSRIRRNERQNLCSSNLRQLAIMYQNYGTDYQDRLFGFTWRVGSEDPYEWPEMPPATTDLEAVSHEVVNMLRFRMEMTDLQPIGGWLPSPKYSHNALCDYIQTVMPMDVAVCPDDTLRSWAMLRLSRGESEHGKGAKYEPRISPLPADAPIADRRWEFSSSYEVVPSSYSPDQGSPSAPTIAQGRTDGEFLVPRISPFGSTGRKLTEISFPASKVGIFDSHDRHSSSKPVFFADPAARQPLMFYDISVRMYRTSDTDPGFQPNDPSSADPTVFDYNPEGEAKRWYPAPVHPEGDRGFKGHYRWTRGGLKGHDISGSGISPGAAAQAFDYTAFERAFR